MIRFWADKIAMSWDQLARIFGGKIVWIKKLDKHLSNLGIANFFKDIKSLGFLHQNLEKSAPFTFIWWKLQVNLVFMTKIA